MKTLYLCGNTKSCKAFLCRLMRIIFLGGSIGTWTIKDIKPSPEGKAQKVKVKARINMHGIMSMSSASLFESKESPDAEPMDEQPAQPEENGEQQQQQQQPSGDTAANNGNGGPPEVGSSWTKKLSAWWGRVRIEPGLP